MKTFYPNTSPPPTTITVNAQPLEDYPSWHEWLAEHKDAVLYQIGDNPPDLGAQLTTIWRTATGEPGDNPRTVIAVLGKETLTAFVDRQFVLIDADMTNYPPG